MNLVAVSDLPTERVEHEDTLPKVGDWYWVTDEKDDEDPGGAASIRYDHKHRYDEPGRRWLACVVHVGSNYAMLEGVHLDDRVGLDVFDDRCARELNPHAYVQKRIGASQNNVRELLGEIQRITALLGVAPREQLDDSAHEGTSALAVAHGTADVKSHKSALIKAKEKTLPNLFKKVEEHHAMMATWMKADLIPAKASLTHMKTSIDRIDDRIQTVELYAGLEETLKLVRKGAPGGNDAKVHIMQRMAFMDEECLANYEAGGMTFDGLKAFDKWLSRDDNFRRLLPHERNILAFRVRHEKRKFEGGDSLSKFIQFMMESKEDEYTFLYIRNGQQLWRMHTSIEFDEKLFPDQRDNSLLGDTDIWINPGASGKRRYITGHDRDGLIAEFKEDTEKLAAKHKKYKDDKKAWDAVEKTFAKERALYKNRDISAIEDEDRQEAFRVHKMAEPHAPWDRVDDSWKRYSKLSPDHLYYDDAMKHIARVAFEHNRIAVIIQGLLDRSKCLLPHPPWRIWTPEGFAAGIELAYDATRVISSGDPVDFPTYRAALNRSLQVGSVVYGQQTAWKMWKATDYAKKNGWRAYDREWHFDPKDNPGPGRFATIVKLTDKTATFAWKKRGERARWVPSDRPGYQRKSYDYEVDVRWTCPIDKLFNVSAYTPGDFHLFYDDPRTRAEYLQWAPFLLSAEDYYGQKRKAGDDDSDR